MKAFYSLLFSGETGKKKTGGEHLFRALLPAEPKSASRQIRSKGAEAQRDEAI